MNPIIARLASKSVVKRIRLEELESEAYKHLDLKKKILEGLDTFDIRGDSTTLEAFKCLSFEYPFV
jgi:hypothetical protein